MLNGQKEDLRVNVPIKIILDIIKTMQIIIYGRSFIGQHLARLLLLLRIIAKELANELKNSQKIVPAKLQNIQYQFVHVNLDEAVTYVFT